MQHPEHRPRKILNFIDDNRALPDERCLRERLLGEQNDVGKVMNVKLALIRKVRAAKFPHGEALRIRQPSLATDTGKRRILLEVHKATALVYAHNPSFQ